MKDDMRLKTIILVIILFLGCSSEKAAVKPPSAESLKVKESIEILLSLNKAYENKDAGSFMLYISPSLSSNYGYLEEKIKRDFNIYEKVSLNISLRWAKLKEDSIQLAIYWEGKWYDQARKEIRYSGNGVFSFKDEGKIKLVRIDGDSPFGVSGD